jgi:hypothetical protein
MQVGPSTAYSFWADDHGFELAGGPPADPSVTLTANQVRLEPGKANLPHIHKNSDDIITHGRSTLHDFHHNLAVPTLRNVIGRGLARQRPFKRFGGSHLEAAVDFDFDDRSGQFAARRLPIRTRRSQSK